MLLVCVLLWGFGFTAGKYALTHGFLPLAFSAPRFAIGAVVFAAYTIRRERSLGIGRADLPLFGVAALFGVLLNQVCYTYALRLTTASTVALVFGALPVLVALLAMGAGHERPRLVHWLATAISFGGVALVAAGAGGGLSGDLGGILLGLGAAATFGCYSVAITPLMRRYSPYRINALVAIAGTVPLAAAASTQLVGQDWAGLPLLAWGGFGYVVAMYILTSILWFEAIDRVGASHAALYANLQPFLGAIFAVLILAESLAPIQVVGGVVIGAGILLARQRRLAAPPVE